MLPITTPVLRITLKLTMINSKKWTMSFSESAIDEFLIYEGHNSSMARNAYFNAISRILNSNMWKAVCASESTTFSYAMFQWIGDVDKLFSPTGDSI